MPVYYQNYRNVPGAQEAYTMYDVPPVMYQPQGPYASVAYETAGGVSPLIGFPSQYPHVIRGTSIPRNQVVYDSPSFMAMQYDLARRAMNAAGGRAAAAAVAPQRTQSSAPASVSRPVPTGAAPTAQQQVTQPTPAPTQPEQPSQTSSSTRPSRRRTQIADTVTGGVPPMPPSSGQPGSPVPIAAPYPYLRPVAMPVAAPSPAPVPAPSPAPVPAPAPEPVPVPSFATLTASATKPTREPTFTELAMPYMTEDTPVELLDLSGTVNLPDLSLPEMNPDVPVEMLDLSGTVNLPEVSVAPVMRDAAGLLLAPQALAQQQGAALLRAMGREAASTPSAMVAAGAQLTPQMAARMALQYATMMGL